MNILDEIYNEWTFIVALAVTLFYSPFKTIFKVICKEKTINAMMVFILILAMTCVLIFFLFCLVSDLTKRL